MSEVWLYSVVGVFIVSLISLVGIFLISVNIEKLKKVLLLLVSFAAGSLLGGAFLHLLPEIFEESTHKSLTSFLILAGILLFFILEKILNWRHCHIPTSADHPHPVAVNNIIGDSFHNFVDGMIIAGSYMVSIPLGIATTIAVIMREIPQEIGDFGILLHAGLTKKALFFNYLSALTAMLGAVVTLSIGSAVEGLQEYIVPFTIGGFIYIATADLIPELKKETNLKKINTAAYRITDRYWYYGSAIIARIIL